MQTGYSFLSVKFNKGKYGEYQIYRQLRYLEKHKAKFLFNLYIPNGWGGTTEIDMLVLSGAGIYVIESKNYGGYVFGSEKQKMWTHVFPKARDKRKRKNKFYNPILQNRNHIRCLKILIGSGWEIYSLVVFSNRCTLRINVRNNEKEKVIYRNGLKGAIQGSIYLNRTEEEIERLYNWLYPFTQVDGEVKKQHIRNIERKKYGL